MHAYTLRDVMSTWAQREPERTAISFVSFSGSHNQCHSLSAGMLDRRARAIATLLLSRMNPGERALLVYPPGIAFAEAFLACLYAGVIPVTLAVPRARSQSRMAHIVRDSTTRLLLTHSDMLAGLPALLDVQLDMLATDEVPESIASDFREVTLDDADVAFLQYTSGSTGQPKGIRISHRALLANLDHIGKAFGHDASSVAVNWLPMHHDMGLIGALLHPLFAGFHAVLMSPGAFIQRPLRWLQLIARFGGTSCGGPSFGYRHCVSRIDLADAAQHDLSTWRVAFCGAEPIQISSLDAFATHFALAGFRATSFLPCYGLAEATLFVTGEAPERGMHKETFDVQSLEQGLAIPAIGGRELVSCGAPSDGTTVAILNPEGKIREDGGIGEVVVAGPGVGSGYWDSGRADDDAFSVALPGFGQRKFLRTGDLGFVFNHTLFITGRAKDVIIVEGRNLAPQDIEWSIVECHQAIRAAMVFGVQVERGEDIVVLAEVSSQEHEESLEAVAFGIRAVTSSIHGVVPAALMLVRAGTLPRTTSGKPMRNQARDLYERGVLHSSSMFCS
ncbi:fatty acyl-AMP ligase [Paraburkholderia aspalathi]|uniref:fatty acyl-AMP ligase n=1 Tax=Paraburkholderia aspalathi TaxID=1324617 RepID=UPI0038BB9A87